MVEIIIIIPYFYFFIWFRWIDKFVTIDDKLIDCEFVSLSLTNSQKAIRPIFVWSHTSKQSTGKPGRITWIRISTRQLTSLRFSCILANVPNFVGVLELHFRVWRSRISKAFDVKKYWSMSYLLTLSVLPCLPPLLYCTPSVGSFHFLLVEFSIPCIFIQPVVCNADVRDWRSRTPNFIQMFKHNICI